MPQSDKLFEQYLGLDDGDGNEEEGFQMTEA